MAQVRAAFGDHAQARRAAAHACRCHGHPGASPRRCQPADRLSRWAVVTLAYRMPGFHRTTISPRPTSWPTCSAASVARSTAGAGRPRAGVGIRLNRAQARCRLRARTRRLFRKAWRPRAAALRHARRSRRHRAERRAARSGRRRRAGRSWRNSPSRMTASAGLAESWSRALAFQGPELARRSRARLPGGDGRRREPPGAREPARHPISAVTAILTPQDCGQARCRRAASAVRRVSAEHPGQAVA